MIKTNKEDIKCDHCGSKDITSCISMTGEEQIVGWKGKLIKVPTQYTCYYCLDCGRYSFYPNKNKKTRR